MVVSERSFVAGGSGVMGTHLVPRLIAAGHVVAAMTRTPGRIPAIRALGAEPVLCDVYDRAALADVLAAFRPDTVIHQLTDLPDSDADLERGRAANARIRREGTANLIAAAQAAGASRLVVQSIAWRVGGRRVSAVIDLEDQTLMAGGTVLRYGQWYGPGTYHPDELPPEPRVHIETAAALTLDALHLPSGVYRVVDDGVQPDPVE
jgi:nucleoside-diphosphate-sugar epimerase